MGNNTGTARGYKSTCLMDFELSGFGQANPAGDRVGKLMPINENRIQATRDKNRPGTITGTRNPAAPFDDRMDVRGDLVVPVDANAFAFWLIAMFGSPDSEPAKTTWAAETAYARGDIVEPGTPNNHLYAAETPGTSGSTEPTWPTDGSAVTDDGVTWRDLGAGVERHRHTFTVGDLQPSFMAEKKFAGPGGTIVHARHLGLKISQLQVDFGGDGELTATLTCIGANEGLEETAYDASPATIALERFNKGHAYLREAGEQVAIVTGAELTVDFNLDDDTYVLGGDVRGDLMEGIIGVSGNLTAFFKSRELLDKAVNSTETELEIRLSRRGYTLAIHIPEMQYGRQTPEITGPQGVRIQLPFEAYFDDDASASAIWAELINDNDGTDYDPFV